MGRRDEQCALGFDVLYPEPHPKHTARRFADTHVFCAVLHQFEPLP